jgi:hypothetical protein
LTAQKTLVSDADVTDASRLISIAGGIESVHRDQFVRQLEEMLPVFIGLALPSLQGRLGHADPFARVTVTESP